MVRLEYDDKREFRTRDGHKAIPVIGVSGCFHLEGETRVDWYAANGQVLRGNGSEHPLDLIAEWTDGPVRTVTRREVVPGVWSGVVVERPTVAVNLHVHLNLHDPSSAELRAAAAVLLELAGALE